MGFLSRLMYRQTMAFGRKGIGMVAISAVDIAIWDILGKACGQPVFRLLGGRTKTKIPVYASRLYSQKLEDVAAEARSCRRDEGYKDDENVASAGDPRMVRRACSGTSNCCAPSAMLSATKSI